MPNKSIRGQFELAVKKSVQVNPMSLLNNFGNTWISGAIDKVVRLSVNQFWRKRALTVFNVYGRWTSNCFNVYGRLSLWPGKLVQFFVSPTTGSYIWNLVITSWAILEKIRQKYRMDDGRTTEPLCAIIFNEAFGSEELKGNLIKGKTGTWRHMRKNSKQVQIDSTLWLLCSFIYVFYRYEISVVEVTRVNCLQFMNTS